jgi:hypothetical protein
VMPAALAQHVRRVERQIEIRCEGKRAIGYQSLSVVKDK